MIRDAFRSSVGVYRHLAAGLVILAIGVIGGLLASYIDPLGIADLLNPTLAYGIYTLTFVALSFPLVFVVMVVRSAVKTLRDRRLRTRLDIDRLRLAEGMVKDGTWRESQEHALTVINDTGHDLKECFIMLDEVAWRNFEGEWQVMSGDLFSEPFKWNAVGAAGRKIDIDNEDRASFALIAHYERSIYSASKKQNDIRTDFYFVFHGDQYTQIGYGPDIRLQISIKGKAEAGKSFPAVRYFLYVSLLQQHGIPKVDVVETERL